VSRDHGPDRDDHDDRPGRDEDPEGRLETTRAGPVAGFALTGLVLGWLVRPVSVGLDGTAPTVGWLPVLVLLFVVVVMGSLAWTTYRMIHRRHERLEPHRAVNRLVLAKASALAGALVAGGYFGYALSWLGHSEALLARGRVVHSVAAGVAAVLLVVGSLLLERACRVGRPRDGR
jgi:small-conductance mechanosensitive channel